MEKILENSQDILLIMIYIALLILLIFLIFIARKVLKQIDKLDILFPQITKGVDLVNMSLDKVQRPLDAIVGVTNFGYIIYENSQKTFKEIKKYAIKNIDILSKKLKEIKEKRKLEAEHDKSGNG